MTKEEKEANKAEQAAQRKRYMAGELTHAQYYEWLADWLGLADRLIPVTAEEVAKSTDPYLNDIRLPMWDSRDDLVRPVAYAKGIAWSLSDTVCTLKAMAKRRNERLKVNPA